MAKSNSELPLLVIKDGEDGGIKTYINRSYVRTALQGIQIMAMQGGEVAEEAKRLVSEIDRQTED